jgi:hypothetical protein
MSNIQRKIEKYRRSTSGLDRSSEIEKETALGGERSTVEFFSTIIGFIWYQPE